MADCKQVSERLIVFQVVLLQHDTAVSKSADVRRLITRRLQLWEDSQFQVLLQEAECSDKSLGRLQHVSRELQQADCAQTSRIFHCVMIQGKVHAAVCWITKHEKGGLQEASDLTKVKTSDDSEVEMTVLEALCLKHPERGIFTSEACKSFDDLPLLSSWTLAGDTSRWLLNGLPGGASPGGSDSGAWQD